MKASCPVCPRRCVLEAGQLGFCRARINRGGVVVCENYGRVTSLALDPIEKKPLRRFHPGAKILSVGSYGCNMDCDYCQNCEISNADAESTPWKQMQPDELVNMAKSLLSQGNIGLAFTYNEPLVGYEFVLDTAKLLRAEGLKTVLVTNGMILTKPWEQLLPFVDAANIDLKAFSAEQYRSLGGNFDAVCEAISLAAGRIHIELTTLIVPGFNDGPDEMRREAAWIASLSKRIPLHISRFFPRYRMIHLPPTPQETVFRLADIAREYLDDVFTGNL